MMDSRLPSYRWAFSGVSNISEYNMSQSTEPAFNKRTGRFQFFLDGATPKDDGRYNGGRAGIITYDKDDNYRVSYVELGFRCDHIVEPIVSAVGHNTAPLNAGSPAEYDEHLVIPATPVTPAVTAAVTV